MSYSPWGHKELDTTQQLNNSNKNSMDDGKYIFKNMQHFLLIFPSTPNEICSQTLDQYYNYTSRSNLSAVLFWETPSHEQL